MVSNNKIYSLGQKLSSVFMIVALLWLTISTPFVFNAQKELAKHHQGCDNQSPLSGNEEESNSFGGNTEEKTPSANLFSEEFLHDCHVSHYFGMETASLYKYENAGTYIAYHGEMLVPPPNAG